MSYLDYVGLQLTGLIFGILAVGLLVYLVPTLLSRQEQVLSEENLAALSETMQIPSATEAQGEGIDENIKVSTPMLRRALIADVRKYQRKTVFARRRFLLLLLVGLMVFIVTSFFHKTEWWTVYVQLGCITAFTIYSRIAKVMIDRVADKQIAQTRLISEEHTKVITRS